MTTFLNEAIARGQASSYFVDQQVARFNSDVISGSTTGPQEVAWLSFLDNYYFGTEPLPAAFAGSPVTNEQATLDGTVWFSCANGVLGEYVPGQLLAPVTAGGVPVNASSMVVAPNGTVWFATYDGRSYYCPEGQTEATLDAGVDCHHGAHEFHGRLLVSR